MKTSIFTLTGTVFLIFIVSCDHKPQNNNGQKAPNKDFVYISDYEPGILLDVRYYSSDNFMGRKVDGYTNQ